MNIPPNDDVEIISDETMYDGFYQIKRYQLRHKRFAGDWTPILTRELFVRRPVAAVLPYDPSRDEVVLIEEFRVGAMAQKHPWLMQIVAGIQEPNETIEEMAKRECQEEAGLAVKKLIKMYECWVSPGGSNEHITLFCGIVDSSNAGGIHGLASEHEDTRVTTVNTNEAFAMISDGRINNAATIMALQWLQINQANIVG